MSEAEARALLDAIANSPADLHRIVSIVQILVPKDQREKLERGCIHIYICMHKAFWKCSGSLEPRIGDLKHQFTGPLKTAVVNGVSDS